MRRVIAALAVSAGIGGGSPARADRHGGGVTVTDTPRKETSSGDASSGDASSGDTSSGSAASGCNDATDIVGYRQCYRFGVWAMKSWIPPLIFELGTTVRRAPSALGEAHGEVTHQGETFRFRAIGSPAGEASARETTVLSTLRVGFGLARGLYLAGELELGGVAQPAARVEITPTDAPLAPTIQPTSSLTVGGLAVAGFHGALGGGTVGVELAGGVRSISYAYESHLLASTAHASLSATSPVLEPRVRAQGWLSPFVSVGAFAGASVLERGAWMAGVQLGFSSQPFGGIGD